MKQKHTDAMYTFHAYREAAAPGNQPADTIVAGMHAHANATMLSGGAAPIYHPSLIPRGKAGSPHAPDGGLQPTSPEAFAELLRVLKTDQRTLEVVCALIRPLVIFLGALVCLRLSTCCKLWVSLARTSVCSYT